MSLNDTLAALARKKQQKEQREADLPGEMQKAQDEYQFLADCIIAAISDTGMEVKQELMKILNQGSSIKQGYDGRRLILEFAGNTVVFAPDTEFLLPPRLKAFMGPAQDPKAIHFGQVGVQTWEVEIPSGGQLRPALKAKPVTPETIQEALDVILRRFL